MIHTILKNWMTQFWEHNTGAERKIIFLIFHFSEGIYFETLDVHSYK